MWQQRMKAWLDAIRARFARRGERTTRSDADGVREPPRDRSSSATARRLRPAPLGAAAHDRRDRRRCRRWRSCMHPPRAGRRPRRSRRAHQPPHRRGQRVERRQRPRPARPARMRVFSLRDRSWRAAQMSRADGPAPLQSVEGPLARRRPDGALRARPAQGCAALAKSLPDNIGSEIVEPAAQGVDLQGVRALHGARDLLDQARRDPAGDRGRAEAAPRRRRPRCCARVQIGKVDLPADYRRGMETPARRGAGDARRCATRSTSRTSASRRPSSTREAEKVRREIGAEAAAREQVIAAKAQEEAMKHVLPFKQRQIEQRQLEAEAEKVTRIKAAEGERAGAPHRGRAARPRRARSSPTPRPTAWSKRRQGRTPSRWRAKARWSRAIRC